MRRPRRESQRDGLNGKQSSEHNANLMRDAQLLLCVLCDDVRQELAGKISLMGLFSNFGVTDFTQPLPPFHIVTRIGVKSEGHHGVKMRLASQEGDFVLELPGELQAR